MTIGRPSQIVPPLLGRTYRTWYRYGVLVLATVLLGILAGILYASWEQGKYPLLASLRAKLGSGSGYSENDDFECYRPPNSFMKYSEYQYKHRDGLGRKRWAVRVFEDSPFQFQYDARGTSTSDIRQVTASTGSVERGRENALCWFFGKGNQIHIGYFTLVSSGTGSSYWDLDGNGTWEMWEQWESIQGKTNATSRFLLVDEEYLPEEALGNRFAKTRTISELDGSNSVVTFVNGKWKRTDASYNTGI